MKKHTEPWVCLMRGRIHSQDGRLHVVNRFFDGSGDIKAAARACLAQRKDKGAPWYGDAVEVTTPLGTHVTVDVPWPEWRHHLADSEETKLVCYEEADRNGVTVAQADACDRGSCGCKNCPFRKD